jgi:processive 1,2-diacylglycerol beta-glucosyltransferase
VRHPRSSAAPCDVLILTGSIGSGHLSVSKAITEALYRQHGKKVHVEIVDLLTTLSNIVTQATKNIYLSSLKISPKIYELLFYHSGASEWPLTVLNALGAPFMQQKFLELLEAMKPRVLVSTYPVWDILVKKVWKKYSRGRLPFVSVITDSMSVHHSWTRGDANYFLVANEDTKVALQNYGIPEKRIKVFGYPISKRFSKHVDCEDWKQKFNLSPRKKTLLLILSAGIRWPKIKKLISVIAKSGLKKMQLVILAAGQPRWEKKLKRMKWPWPTRVTGWTNEMHTFIHGSDVVLTKAGGATVMECVASQKPMVIIDAIPGQEIGNAVLVQKYNLGVVLNRDLKDFDRAVEYIFEHEHLIKLNLASLQKPHAAEDIAKFLMELL